MSGEGLIPNAKSEGSEKTSKPNKPDKDGAVENQSQVTPDDYPESDGGKPNYKDRDEA